MYIKGIVTDKIVEEVRIRLDKIDIDGILDSGYMKNSFRTKHTLLFQRLITPSGPMWQLPGCWKDASLYWSMEAPLSIVPTLFISFFQSAEDYYQRADISTLLRIIRFISLFIAMVGPALYIAVTTFHQELIPTQLLISLASQREVFPSPLSSKLC